MLKDKMIYVHLIILMIINIFMIMTYASSLHNIDLSWNVKHLDIQDCNGLICEDIEYFYQRGMLYAWFFPIMFGISSISMGFLFGRLYQDIKRKKLKFNKK